MRAGLYARVSTDDQDTDNQVPRIQDYIRSRQWDLKEKHVFIEEKGISGKVFDRPALNELKKAVRKRSLDVVVFTKLDRLGRKVRGLTDIMEEWNNLGVQMVAIDQQIDTTGPWGRFQFHVISAFAEVEREVISERTKEALEVKRRNGEVLGRPPVYLETEADSLLKLLVSQKTPLRRILEELQIEGYQAIRTTKGGKKKSIPITLHLVRKRVSEIQGESPHKSGSSEAVRKTNVSHTMGIVRDRSEKATEGIN